MHVLSRSCMASTFSWLWSLHSCFCTNLWISLDTTSTCRSLWRSLFLMYQGTLTMCLSALSWNRCIMSILLWCNPRVEYRMTKRVLGFVCIKEVWFHTCNCKFRQCFSALALGDTLKYGLISQGTPHRVLLKIWLFSCFLPVLICTYFCFSLYCGGFILFCTVCVCVCVCVYVWVLQCVCLWGFCNVWVFW
jgi:hypothetical protein